MSPDHRLLAYSTDENGGERYTLRFRDLTSGDDLPDVVDDVTYGLAWSNDVATCFYVRPDEAMRPHEVWRHRLGTPTTDDVRVFREDDERFFLGVGRTRSGSFVLIDAESKLTSETWFIPSDEPERAPTVIAPREHEHEYSVDHHEHPDFGDRFLIVTNSEGARNFRVVTAPVTDPGRANWTELVAHHPDVRIDSVDAFREHLAISERAEGLDRVRVMRFETGAWNTLPASDPVYSMWVGPNLEFETAMLRYGYTSLVAPVTDLDYEPESGSTTIVKVQPVLGGYDQSAYTSARVWATAADGTADPDLRGAPARRRARRERARAARRLRRVRALERSRVPRRSAVVARSRVHRARSRTYAAAASSVASGTSRAGSSTRRIRSPTSSRVPKRLIANNYTAAGRIVARGGSAGGLLDGCGREPAARSLRGDRRRGSLRRHRHDHARPRAPAHRHRVGGVG